MCKISDAQQVLAHGSSGCVIVLVRSVLSGAPVSAGLRSTVGWRRQLQQGGKAGSGFAPGRAGASAPLARFHGALMPLESHGAAGAEPPARRERRRASPPQCRLTVTGSPRCTLGDRLTGKVRGSRWPPAAANSRAARNQAGT